LWWSGEEKEDDASRNTTNWQINIETPVFYVSVVDSKT
jgi:hypothetical protein